MFQAKTERISKIAAELGTAISKLDPIFGVNNVTYMDWGNVRNWANKLGWHVCHRRLKQLIDSFSGPTAAKLYYGTLAGDIDSENFIRESNLYGYDVHTKVVKCIRFPMDVSSISAESPDIIKNFIFRDS